MRVPALHDIQAIPAEPRSPVNGVFEMSRHADFTGTWRADLAASRLHGQTPNDITASIHHAEPELRIVMTIAVGTRSTRMEFAVCDTGEARTNAVLGTEWVSRSRWVGRELLIESYVDAGGRQMHYRDYWSISDDGRRLIMEHRGDDLDGQITVFDRVEGADQVARPLSTTRPGRSPR